MFDKLKLEFCQKHLFNEEEQKKFLIYFDGLMKGFLFYLGKDKKIIKKNRCRTEV